MGDGQEAIWAQRVGTTYDVEHSVTHGILSLSPGLNLGLK
jgi:hypothetical protein